MLVDGEHQPAVVRAALDELASRGTHAIAAVVLGGSEKVAEGGTPPPLGVPVRWPDDAEAALPGLLRELRPDVVVDLSGPPVVLPRRRLGLVATALEAGVAYEAPGVRYEPPDLPVLTTRPTVAVVSTDKRSGKTAIAGAFVRHAQQAGRVPVLVAMGRGGPQEPTLVEAGARLDPRRLLEIADDGGHAASDYLEDALMTGAATVGCRRAGDGPAGAVGVSNVPEGVALAESQPGDLTVLEGSGAAIPPCRADATILVVPATADPADLEAAVPLAVRLADVLVVTNAGPPVAPADVVRTVAAVARLRAAGPHRPELPVVLTAFEPVPLGSVAGQRVLLATTAPGRAAAGIAEHLASLCGAEVVGVTRNLSDRSRLREDLDAAPPHDAVVTELKAAAVDIVVRRAVDAGVRVVFLDNRPRTLVLPASLAPTAPDDLAAAFDRVLACAASRHASRVATPQATAG